MNQSGFDPSHIASFLLPMMIIGVIVTIVSTIPYWFIFKKAGFSPWLTVLMFVPLVNLIILYVIAFSDWKVVPVPAYPDSNFTSLPPRA